jgi:hypothetical protein
VALVTGFHSRPIESGQAKFILRFTGTLIIVNEESLIPVKPLLVTLINASSVILFGTTHE